MILLTPKSPIYLINFYFSLIIKKNIVKLDISV